MDTPSSHAPKLSVLIVDDARSFRELLRTVLNQNGYSVVGELDDGSSVLTTVARTKPDLVCLDLNMPKVNGMSVLKDMNASYPKVPVLMMTGDASHGVYHEATKLGAAGFLLKPFSPQQILDELGHVATALRLMRKKKVSGTALASAVRKRVVIADDSLTQRHVLRAILESMSFIVVGEAKDGQQAIDITRLVKPDLVCLDVEMPVLNGLQALAKLHTTAPALPVVMITSRSDRETVQKAAEFGVKGYIVKPYQPEKVELAIRKILNL